MVVSPSDVLETKMTTSISSVFAEHDVAFENINILIQDDSSVVEMDQALRELRSIFDKYLELPSLLDKYVEAMVQQLSTAARRRMDDTKSLERVEKFSSCALPRQLSALYALCKVRGRKRIQNFLPHRVEDVHATLRTLQALHKLSKGTDDGSAGNTIAISEIGQPELWESIYVLWSWMGMLSLVPFHSVIVVEKDNIDALVDLAKSYFHEAGPTREMAAVCLASWLSRPDLEKSHLEDFQGWAIDILNEYLHHARDTVRLMAILQTLVTIFKVSTSDREVLLRFAVPLGDSVLRLSDTKPNNLHVRKYLVKWWTRIAVLHMPPRIATWRYHRGRRSLKENLLSRGGHDKKAKKGADDSLSLLKNRSIQDYELFAVPDAVEESIGELIGGLADQSAVVRWSAAKGVGRVVERLPAICSDDVLDALLALFDDKEKDNDWQGACLAMAELARRGLLLPHRLQEVVHRISEAIHYDVPRRQTTVGVHVRDAACYVNWAIARAYSPEVLRPFVQVLSESVVTAFLFDREVNCRRAASAAFQEFVGRQGAANFKHGIEILTKADFFSLGNRGDAYLAIAPEIARHEEYRKSIIFHLYRIKLQHWDISIRILSSKALGRLVELDRDILCTEVIPYLLENSLDEKNMQLRHGSILALSEIIRAIGGLDNMSSGISGVFLEDEVLKDVAELVPRVEKKRLYRGKGGEQMRAAVCRLIECISIARVPLSVSQQVRLLDTIDACIPHPNEDIQEQATMALSQLLTFYFPIGRKGPSDRLQKRVVDKYVKQVTTSTNAGATRGFSMALGRLPSKLLAPSSAVLDKALACLCRMSRPDTTTGTYKDAESRRNALVALARICRTVAVSPSGEDACTVGLTDKQLGHVFAALLRGLDDYNMERRGDVGSMSRIAAMEGLVSIAKTVCSSRDLDRISATFDVISCTKIVAGLLKQLSEKLDSVRSVSGRCIVQILVDLDPVILPYVREKEQVCSYLKIEDETNAMHVNWSDATVTFPLVTKCLDIETYSLHVLSGLIISVGCLTQSVSKEAGMALVQWLKSAPLNSIHRTGEAFLDIFEKHLREGRVILPLLKTITLLINRLSIEALINDSTFAKRCLQLLREEERSCSDIHRLAAIIDVTMGLLGAENGQQKEILSFTCQMLIHSYPRIRRITAEQLYTKLVEEQGLGANDEVLDLLLTSPWDGVEAAEDVAIFAQAVASSLKLDSLANLTKKEP